MMKISRLFFFMTFISVTAFAARTPNDEKVVVGYADANNKLYNVTDIYGRVIDYKINKDKITIKTKTAEGKDVNVTIDYKQYVDEAFSLWRQSGLKTENVTEKETKTVLFDISNYGDDSLGSTVFSITENTKLNIDEKSFNNIVMKNYNPLKSKGALTENITPEEYIRMKLKLTLIHEIGHVLGLLHNDDAGKTYSLGKGKKIVSCLLLDQAPSIMLNGARYDYIDRLYNHLGRPVTISDIKPSPNDISGVKIMLQGGRGNSFSAFSCIGGGSGNEL